MDNKRTSRLSGNTAVAVLAGVLGSVLTLAATTYFGEFAPAVSSSVFGDAPKHGSSADKLTKNLPENDKIAEGIESVHDDLRKALSDASAERSQLANVLALLTQKIDTLENEAASLQSSAELDEQFLLNGSGTLPQAGEESSFAQPGGQSNSDRTVQNLIAAGLDEQTAGDVQAKRDRFQLARLELFDQATREGWIDSDDFGERLSELDGQRVDLREELGASAYDEYLFESGGNNRVGIQSVINGSAAQIAGLQSGDIVISYADERVFNTRELQTATRGGSRGEYVQVSFERAGQFLSADVPRGPLGVTLRSSRAEP